MYILLHETIGHVVHLIKMVVIWIDNLSTECTHWNDFHFLQSKDRVKELLVTIQNKEEKVIQVANVLVNYCLDER